MAVKDITQTPIATSLTEEDHIVGVFGGKTGRTKVAALKEHLEGTDMYLQQVAFFIDINEPADVATNVNTGGNMNMRRMWEDHWRAGVMDPSGRWAPLSPENSNYFADGTQAVDAGGEAVSGIANCDFMNIIPDTYCYIQTVDMGGKTIDRLWLSLLTLPGGWKESRQVVGAFKGTTIGGQLRSLPGKEVTRSKTVRAFWLEAQARSKKHGLAGVYFRNFLLFYMMSKYGQRSSQTAKLADGTLIWGPGLDGTASESYLDQYPIETGATLHLGARDGNVNVLDSKGATCQSVRVKNFENPWGQFWEHDGHQISFGTDVYAWRSNFMPISNAPTKEDFANIECDKYTRHTTTINSGEKMNMLKGDKQGVFMIPFGTTSGISYGDRYFYDAAGQLWRWGGYSSSGSNCGLAYTSSDDVWTYSSTNIGARLAYYGEITEVTGADLVA